MSENTLTTNCQRCDVECQVAGPRNQDAKLLRRSKEPKGLCVNCAVHDWLRNTYPVNMLLAQSGPKGLVHPHIQEQFAGIMKMGMADAMPDEIGWELIIENWDLPFSHKVKPSNTNPCSQLQLDEITSGDSPGIGELPEKRGSICDPEHLQITSFEQLNEQDPGLGDDLRKCLGTE